MEPVCCMVLEHAQLAFLEHALARRPRESNDHQRSHRLAAGNLVHRTSSGIDSVSPRTGGVVGRMAVPASLCPCQHDPAQGAMIEGISLSAPSTVSIMRGRWRCAACAPREPVQAMSETDASWPTTSPGARVASAPDRVPVHDALCPGTRLDEFEILRVLGVGGFGIVYLARDHVAERKVALKEYMPASLAARGAGAAGRAALAPTFAETFALGLRLVRQRGAAARPLRPSVAGQGLPLLGSNGTAYMAMPYYPGATLTRRAPAHGRAARRGLAARVDRRRCSTRSSCCTAQGVYHRDIAPDNILLLPDGRPVLLDFGAARRVIGDRTQSLTAILKPSFAPIEQYADDRAACGRARGPTSTRSARRCTSCSPGARRRRPWCAPFATRCRRSPSQAGSAIPRVRASLLATIDWTLALAPEDRPQSVPSVRRALSGEIAPPPPSPRQLGARLPWRRMPRPCPMTRPRSSRRRCEAGPALVLAAGGHLLGAAGGPRFDAVAFAPPRSAQRGLSCSR